jgi:hypothetical protein
MLSVMEAPNIEDVHILTGSNDSRWPSQMFMIKDAPWMTSGAVKRVYCSFEFTDLNGPLTFHRGYENFQVLDLSCVGSYHEAAVEWIIALGTSLQDLRIQASVNQVSRASALPNAFYALRRVKIPETVVSHISSLRIAHFIGQETNHLGRRAFLSKFVFPDLKELVLHYCHDSAFPCNVSWLMRSPFPALTTFHVTSNSIRHDLLADILRSMPALQTLVFVPHTDWDCRSSWGTSTRSRTVIQDNSFLRALGHASQALEVVKVGGDVWFDRRTLMNFCTSFQKIT